jgi:hypothetical protein
MHSTFAPTPARARLELAANFPSPAALNFTRPRRFVSMNSARRVSTSGRRPRCSFFLK